MSYKNLLTSGFKDIQKLEINELITRGQLICEDQFTVDGNLNANSSIQVNEGIIFLSGPSNFSLTDYDEFYGNISWSGNDGTPSVTTNGISMSKVGNLINIRLGAISLTAGASTPNTYLVSEAAIFPANMIPETDNIITLGQIRFGENGVFSIGQVEYHKAQNELRIYKDVAKSAIANAATIVTDNVFNGSYQKRSFIA